MKRAADQRLFLFGTPEGIKALIEHKTRPKGLIDLIGV
jgi:hypothetical protein